MPSEEHPTRSQPSWSLWFLADPRRWQPLGLVVLFLEAVAKYSQTITTTLRQRWWTAGQRASRLQQEQEQEQQQEQQQEQYTVMSSVDYTQPPPKLVLDEFIARALSSTPPELHPFFEAFGNLLWHQLTLKLCEFFDHPLSAPFRVDLFHYFVRDFESRLNQQRLVEMATKVSKEIDNPQTQLSFLTSLLSRIDEEKSKEAYVLLLANIAHAKLLYGDLEGTKTDMDTAWKTLDQLEGVDNAVNAAYYRVAADYYKEREHAKAEYAPYYKHSLLYLACVDIATDLTADERLLRAHDLGISAFLGDTIYNFGTLANARAVRQPILEESYPFLRQKICLMALIESVFKRNTNDRTMSFQTIAEETRLPLDEVEHLIMKALRDYHSRQVRSLARLPVMSKQTESTCTPPSAPTFSFTAPLPPPAAAASSSAPAASATAATAAPNPTLKQRRVSLALPSSPRLVPAWNFRDDTGLTSHVAETSVRMPERRGKMRKIADDAQSRDPDGLVIQQKKQRKKWSEEETQMLVTGCNTWGVGNWKAILKDPSLKFDNRSPVDLKDRFRTYFPDAYKEHYPNAKTHLSSKVRSTLPDGRSIFEKTRSKKRRPFTEEEDRALKAGYEKHGTVWAAIVKDPIFQEQNRRSTDLRDRFRNAFPELYQAAGYKPRNSSKKRKEGGVPVPVRAATDDQLTTSSSHIGPTRKKRASRQGALRGGTKSVPESATCSEEEESSCGEEENRTRLFRCPPISTEASPPGDTPSSSEPFAEMDMETIDPLSEPLSIPDFMPSATQSLSELTDSSQSQTAWSGLDTPVHPSSWSTNAGSPTSSHISSDYLLNQSPFIRRMSTIGKSAWGPQDWFSANPRLDTSAFSSSGSSFADGLSPASSSPFSFHHLSHGVMDRYDLFPTSFPHDFASEAGAGDTHSTFSDPEMFPTSSFRGFTHHSSYAGDLIFGARTHQPQQSYYGPGFGFGTPGLGLSGMQQSSDIHSIQMHTAPLPGIDEIELASITLNDQAEISRDPTSTVSEIEVQKDEKETDLNISSTLDLFGIASQSSMDDIVDLSHSTPPATPLDSARPMRSHSHVHHSHGSGRSVSVPPPEARMNTARPQPGHEHPQPQISTTRSLPPFFATPSPPTHTAGLTHAHSNTEADAGRPPVPNATADTWRSPNPPDIHGLPFLDLHYYSGNNHTLDGGHESNTASANSSRQGQALDLARSNTSLRSAPAISPYSTVSHALHVAQPLHAADIGISTRQAHGLHHRGTSSVAPQDLQLRRANDNKRKRASWDGGSF
ncbi:hypothetical protein ID866_3676 [Astraeus odoratus]|nr:hypothetical protein ID866_3676 [Astraeus odoratus]